MALPVIKTGERHGAVPEALARYCRVGRTVPSRSFQNFIPRIGSHSLASLVGINDENWRLVKGSLLFLSNTFRIIISRAKALPRSLSSLQPYRSSLLISFCLTPWKS